MEMGHKFIRCSASSHARTGTCTHTHIHIHIHTRTHMHTHVHTNTHTYTIIPTYPPTRPSTSPPLQSTGANSVWVSNNPEPEHFQLSKLYGKRLPPPHHLTWQRVCVICEACVRVIFVYCYICSSGGKRRPSRDLFFKDNRRTFVFGSYTFLVFPPRVLAQVLST